MKALEGVYKIQNNENSKKYIGSSTNIENRFLRHKSLLRKGIHHNKALQDDWNKYGEEAFSFELIREISGKGWYEVRQVKNSKTWYMEKRLLSNYSLTAWEQATIKLYPSNQLYNIKVANSFDEISQLDHRFMRQEIMSEI